MGYTPIQTFADGDDAPGPEIWNQIRDNFAAGVPDIMTTAGDLAIATAADTAARFPVGANGQVLAVNTANPTKTEWKYPTAGARGYHNSGFTAVSEGNYTHVPVAAEDWDVNGDFAQPGAIYTCRDSGKYLIYGGVLVHFNAGAPAVSEHESLYIYINGLAVSEIAAQYAQAITATDIMLAGMDILNLAAGDEIELKCKAGGSGDTVYFGNTGNPCVELHVVYLGP